MKQREKKRTKASIKVPLTRTRARIFKLRCIRLRLHHGRTFPFAVAIFDFAVATNNSNHGRLHRFQKAYITGIYGYTGTASFGRVTSLSTAGTPSKYPGAVLIQPRSFIHCIGYK